MENRGRNAENGDTLESATELTGSTARDLMTSAVLTLRPDQPIQDAVDLFARREFRHIPIVDGQRLVGVLSDRDVLRALVRSLDIAATPVSAIMKASPYTVGPDASIGEAVYLLVSHRINCLPVVEKDALLGILTTTDLLRVLLAAAT